MNNEEMKRAVEAILFAAGESVEISRIGEALELTPKKAEKLLAPEAERLRRLAMLTAEHEVTDNGCFVTLAMDDGKGEIIRMRLLCSGEEQAKRIEEGFKRSAEEIYGKIIVMLDD